MHRWILVIDVSPQDIFLDELIKNELSMHGMATSQVIADDNNGR